MNEALRAESERLARSWEQYDAEKLRSYLVASVEDPRVNLQSILTRHFLLSLLFGQQFNDLKTHELQFGAVMGWIFAMLSRHAHPDDWQSILFALDHGSDNAEGFEIPSFVLRAYKCLPASAADVAVPNYIREALIPLKNLPPGERTAGLEIFNSFEHLWREQLKPEPARTLAACEAACGSANDYRFIESFGIARLLDYTGFDISPKNIANATAMFPHRRFRVGNVFAIDLPAQSVDACYFHDLLEHLSPEGLPQAISELCRITKRSICAGLFSVYEGSDDVVRPVDDYYCSTLSLPRLQGLLRQHGFAARPVHIDSYARKQFPQHAYHNPNAYTLFCDRVM